MSLFVWVRNPRWLTYVFTSEFHKPSVKVKAGRLSQIWSLTGKRSVSALTWLLGALNSLWSGGWVLFPVPGWLLSQVLATHAFSNGHWPPESQQRIESFWKPDLTALCNTLLYIYHLYHLLVRSQSHPAHTQGEKNYINI